MYSRYFTFKNVIITLTFIVFFTCIIKLLAPIQDIFYKLDATSYNFFNKLIINNHNLATICGILNHKNETWLNVIIMFSINCIFWLIAKPASRNQIGKEIIYFWLLFQIVILINHTIFNYWLQIRRASPTLVIPGTLLSNIISNSNLKEFSAVSFPAGHALVAIYWASFTYPHASNILGKILIITLSTVLCLSRLFSGAHWLTDVLFSIFLARIWYMLFKTAILSLKR